MAYRIRGATERDIDGIARVKEAVWSDNDPRRDLIGGVISDSEHVLLVAEDNDVIAGFTDGFLTCSSTGVLRWELDLIAVHPDFQQRGIAAELMRLDTAAGETRGAMEARGLVEITNVGSQKTFARCDYHVDDQICGLFVLSQPKLIDGELISLAEEEAPAYIKAVSTLNYRGLWLEDRWDRNIVRIVSAKYVEEGQELAGSVIPLQEAEAVKSVTEAGFELAGRYQWWSRKLTKSVPH